MRTDYYGIQTPVLQATSQAIRTVNGTVGTIAPEDWGNLIRAMHSQSDYDNVMAQLVEETVSGSIVSFADGANNLPCKNVEVNIDAWQEGTGDPTPNNKRTIHGRNSVDLSVNGVIITINLGGTYYGCVLDVTSGVMTVTHSTYILSTIESYTTWYNRQIALVRPHNIIQTIQSVLNVYGDVLKATSLPTDDFACWHRYSNVNIIVPDNYTVADYNNNIAGTKIVYPLETPFTVQLTPQQVSTLLGNNTFFADTGDISMTYRANGALYVAQH